MGRPKLAPEDRRTEVIRIRLTHGEREVWASAAGKQDLSSFIRGMADEVEAAAGNQRLESISPNADNRKRGPLSGATFRPRDALTMPIRRRRHLLFWTAGLIFALILVPFLAELFFPL